MQRCDDAGGGLKPTNPVRWRAMPARPSQFARTNRNATGTRRSLCLRAGLLAQDRYSRITFPPTIRQQWHGSKAPDRFATRPIQRRVRGGFSPPSHGLAAARGQDQYSNRDPERNFKMSRHWVQRRIVAHLWWGRHSCPFLIFFGFTPHVATFCRRISAIRSKQELAPSTSFICLRHRPKSSSRLINCG
jgi:hypothetical protein